MKITKLAKKRDYSTMKASGSCCSCSTSTSCFQDTASNVGLSIGISLVVSASIYLFFALKKPVIK